MHQKPSKFEFWYICQINHEWKVTKPHHWSCRRNKIADRGTYNNLKALHTTRYPPLSDQLPAIFHLLVGIEPLCTPSNVRMYEINNWKTNLIKTSKKFMPIYNKQILTLHQRSNKIVKSTSKTFLCWHSAWSNSV